MNKTEYDFYYSAKHEVANKRSAIERGEKYVTTYFKGKKYTEMISKGRTPVTNWQGDLIKLGTGTISDIN